MAPANQRFRTDQAAIRQTNLRLIEQFEFISVGRERQFSLQRQPRFEFRPDRVLEDHVTAAAGRLGAAEREMAVAQEFVSRAAAVRVGSGATTDLYAGLTRSTPKRRVGRHTATSGH